MMEPSGFNIKSYFQSRIQGAQEDDQRTARQVPVRTNIFADFFDGVEGVSPLGSSPPESPLTGKGKRKAEGFLETSDLGAAPLMYTTGLSDLTNLDGAPAKEQVSPRRLGFSEMTGQGRIDMSSSPGSFILRRSNKRSKVATSLPPEKQRSKETENLIEIIRNYKKTDGFNYSWPEARSLVRSFSESKRRMFLNSEITIDGIEYKLTKIGNGNFSAVFTLEPKNQKDFSKAEDGKLSHPFDGKVVKIPFKKVCDIAAFNAAMRDAEIPVLPLTKVEGTDIEDCYVQDICDTLYSKQDLKALIKANPDLAKEDEADSLRSFVENQFRSFVAWVRTEPDRVNGIVKETAFFDFHPDDICVHKGHWVMVDIGGEEGQVGDDGDDDWSMQVNTCLRMWNDVFPGIQEKLRNEFGI